MSAGKTKFPDIPSTYKIAVRRLLAALLFGYMFLLRISLGIDRMIDPTQVPRARRLLQCFFGVFFCLLSAGVIFGWAALKPVLIREGVYAELCPDGKVPCVQQDVRLNLIFTLATVATNVAALPIGSLLDRVGPRRTSIVGSIIFLLGNLLLGLQSRTFDSYLIGYIALALGGPLIFLSSFHLSNAFPSHSGLILSAITGAFDASSLPYLAYRQLYNAYGLSLRTFFWMYGLVSVAVVVEQLTLGCEQPYGNGDSSSTEDSPQQTERAPLLQRKLSNSQKHSRNRRSSRVHYGDVHDADDHAVFKETMSRKDPLTGQLFGIKATQQITTPYFLVIAIYLCITMVRLNFYIETVQEQLLFYTGEASVANTLTTTFTVLLPVGGIVAIPIIGIILDKRTSFDAFAVLLLLSLAYSVFGLSHSGALQVMSIAMFAVLRPMMYTTVSDYCAKVFSFATFGKVYGLLNTLSGLFSLIQWPLDSLVKYRLEANPTLVNIGLLTMGSAANVALLWRIKRC